MKCYTYTTEWSVYPNELSATEIVLYHHFSTRHCIDIFVDHSTMYMFVTAETNWLTVFEETLVLKTLATPGTLAISKQNG